MKSNDIGAYIRSKIKEKQILEKYFGATVVSGTFCVPKTPIKIEKDPIKALMQKIGYENLG